MSKWDALATGEELRKARRERRKEYIDRRERREALPSLESEGWTLVSEYKDARFVKVRKKKSTSVRFENRVWMLFFLMGYERMNSDNSFVVSWGKRDEVQSKQIDVFAFDGETAIAVECKAADSPGTKKDFKTEIESMGYYTQFVAGEIRNQFGRGTKVKFIFATSNYVLGDADLNRLKDLKIEHFDDEAVDYYTELAQHLGTSAKYQLLGKLFANKKIDNMIETVPAIRGKMGGHTYYSFSIEPERLLKIGYVLHRSDANKTMMPTYQRVIKKSRLQQVREFVENGGYFPNSVIVSIEAPKKGLSFDVKTGDEASIAQLGILHLPKKYCSAYIIDGQHRLYGYTDTKYAETNTIPVVAFENLDKEEQIRLFMEINENQKAVPKNLRNTLSADLLWTSDSYADRRKALRLRAAEALGESQGSPLYGRVLIGENKKTPTRCVTMDSIERGVRGGKYLAVFDRSSNALVNIGQFDDGNPDNAPAFNKLMSFLQVAFGYLRERLSEEWDRGEDDQGLLTNNTGIQALLRVFSDMIDFCEKQNGLNPKLEASEAIVRNIQPLLDAVIDFYVEMSPELRNEIKTQYGTNGPTQHWRYLQKAVHDRYEEFAPDGFDVWWADNSKQYNGAALDMLEAISAETIKRVKQMLDATGSELPFKVARELNDRKFKENEKRRKEGRGLVGDWDVFTLADCETLANEGRLWTEGLREVLTRPGQEGRKGGNKAAKTRWLSDMSRIRNSLNRSSYSVKQSDYEYISSIYYWIFGVDYSTGADS